MYCNHPGTTRVYIERAAAEDADRSILANISVYFRLECPACHTICEYERVVYGSQYAMGPAEAGTFKYHLPRFSDLWENVVARIGSVNCHGCGTTGILIEGHANELASRLRVGYHARAMCAALAQLGFTVDAEMETYSTTRGAPFAKTEIRPSLLPDHPIRRPGPPGPGLTFL